MSLKEVLLTLTSIETGDVYCARSYPHSDFNKNGRTELYGVPVYKLTLKSTLGVRTWKCLRFMPYWNDPENPSPHYRHKGWANSGLADPITRKAVTNYNKNYRVQNTPSPYDGAIQIRDSFLIHAGPSTLKEWGWGAAGCVEVIGNFTLFKKDIRDLSGSEVSDFDNAILQLIKEKKLILTLQKAVRPNLKKNLLGEI